MGTLGAVACGGRACLLLQTETCAGSLTWQGRVGADAVEGRLVDEAGLVWAAAAGGLAGVIGNADASLQQALAAAMAVSEPTAAPAAAAACLAGAGTAADACLALSWQGQVAWVGADSHAAPTWVGRGHRALVRAGAHGGDSAGEGGAEDAPSAWRQRLFETVLADLFIWLPALDDDELAGRCQAALSADDPAPDLGDTAVCWLGNSGWVRSGAGVWRAVAP